MMKLDLREIAAHLGKRIRYEIDEKTVEDLGEGLRVLEPVKGDVTFANTGRSIVVRGNFKTSVELECGRCLECYKIDLDIPIEEELPISGRPPWVEEEEEEESISEEEKEPLFVDNIFDLEELLRQSILVSVPIKPLCSEACKGLCPQCGVNLNERPCECPTDAETTPFAALSSLLKEDEDREPES